MHDRSDTESSVIDAMRFCKRHPLTRLRLTQDQGHSKIVSPESTWQEMKSHLNYEDTTVNFADKILAEIV